MNENLRIAADALTVRQHDPQAPIDDVVVSFLTDFGYLDRKSGAVAENIDVVHTQRLLRAAAEMQRIFPMHAPNAPGLYFFGGQTHPSLVSKDFDKCGPINMTGSGHTRREAFEACVGEGVEFLSQYLQEKELPARDTACELVDVFPAARPEWIPKRRREIVNGIRLSDKRMVQLPADRCVRRACTDGDAMPFALGTGCGASATRDAAILHGLFELIERDATALWWRGGLKPRQIALEDPAQRAASELASEIRGSSSARRSRLLDITTDIGIPCFAAISTDNSGRALACGSASHLSATKAAQAALRELCQMELAQNIIDTKLRERGVGGLSASDQRYLRRLECSDPDRLGPLIPERLSRAKGAPIIPDLGPSELLETVLRLLTGLDIDVFLVDLTSELFEIPVARVIAPQLQLDPCSLESTRLRRAKETSARHQEPFSLF